MWLMTHSLVQCGFVTCKCEAPEARHTFEWRMRHDSWLMTHQNSWRITHHVTYMIMHIKRDTSPIWVTNVTWLMTHSLLRCAFVTCMCDVSEEHHAFEWHAWHDSWLMTHDFMSHVTYRKMHVKWDTSRIWVTNMTWLMTHSLLRCAFVTTLCVWGASFIQHPYVWHDLFICHTHLCVIRWSLICDSSVCHLYMCVINDDKFERERGRDRQSNVLSLICVSLIWGGFG